MTSLIYSRIIIKLRRILNIVSITSNKARKRRRRTKKLGKTLGKGPNPRSCAAKVLRRRILRPLLN